jgi:hypothetical protein
MLIYLVRVRCGQAGNAGAVLSCAYVCGNPLIEALTIGQACVACLATWVALNGSSALAFESACTRQVCKYKGIAKFTEYLVTCD